jgi:hypothetical protein
VLPLHTRRDTKATCQQYHKIIIFCIPVADSYHGSYLYFAYIQNKVLHKMEILVTVICIVRSIIVLKISRADHLGRILRAAVDPSGYYLIHKSSPPDTNVDQLDTVLIFSLRSVLISTIHLHLGFPSSLFIWRSAIKFWFVFPTCFIYRVFQKRTA